MAGIAVVNGCGKAADLSGVHLERVGVPEALGAGVHDLYFQPVHEEFQARPRWSLSDAGPIPQYKPTAKFTGFLQSARPAPRDYRRTVLESCRLSQPIGEAAGTVNRTLLANERGSTPVILEHAHETPVNE